MTLLQRCSAMPRRASACLAIAAILATAGCNKLAELAGAPTVSNVTVHAPAGILVGDSAQVSVDATKSDGTVIVGLATVDSWTSSNPSVLSISSAGVIKGLATGQATMS